MRYSEIIAETSMSEIAHVVSDVRNLDTAVSSVNLDDQLVTLRFVLYDRPGRITLRPRPGIKFRSKVYAAALAMNDGKQMPWAKASDAITGRIRPQAIKILTNPAFWAIAGMQYENIKF